MMIARNFIQKYILSEDLSLEARKINMIYLVGIVVAGIGFFLRLAMGSPIELCLVIGSISIAAALLMFIANHFNAFKIATWVTVIMIADLFFALAYFFIGGVDSSISAYFVLSVTIIVLLLSGVSRFVMLGVQFIIAGLCFLVERHYPAAVVPINHDMQLLDGYVSYIMIACYIGAIIVLLERLQARERQRVANINRMLSAGNTTADLLFASSSENLEESLQAAMGILGVHLDVDRMYV